MEHQGYDISLTRRIIPTIQRLLHACRAVSIQVYHTREGKYAHPSLFLMLLSYSHSLPPVAIILSFSSSSCPEKQTHDSPPLDILL